MSRKAYFISVAMVAFSYVVMATVGWWENSYTQSQLYAARVADDDVQATLVVAMRARGYLP